MIFRCPHCNGACSLPEGSSGRSWACPRCGKEIPANLLAAAPTPAATETKPASQPVTASAERTPSRPAAAPARTPATKAAPKSDPKPTAAKETQAVIKSSGTPKPASAGLSERPTPLDKALSVPVTRWPRRLMTLTCLTLSLVVLASSAALATWKLRKMRSPTPSSPVVVEPKAEEASRPSELPPKPAEQLYGGIEIGSKGVKLVVVRLREAMLGGPPVELARPAQTANTTLVTGLKETGILNPSALQDTVRVVGNYHEQLQREHELPPERIYIIASSGLFASIRDKPDQMEAHKRHLTEAIKKATGHDLLFLDEAQDLELTFRASVPLKESAEALLVDLSSGKTSACYGEGSLGRFVPLSFPFGAVPLAEEAQRRVQDRGGKLAERIDEILKEDDKLQPWREGVQRLPGLATLKQVYLTGGPIWALATIVHPQERGRCVELTFAEVEAFARELEASPPSVIPEPKWTGDADEATRKQVAAAMRDVRRAFNREQLLAGMHILLALAGDLGFKNTSEKKMVFARDGYLGPSIGYAARLKNKTPQ